MPVVAERDEESQPYLPVFLKSRKYVDLSDATKREENYESLLRALADKPLLVPPPVGKLPAFLREDGAVSSPTSAKLRAAENAVLGHKPTSGGLLEDYFEVLRTQIGQLALSLDEATNQEGRYAAYDKRLETWTPLRDEFVGLLRHVFRYGQGPQLTERLPRFFDSVLPLSYELNDNGLLDIVRFAVYESFLYSVALLFEHNEFEALATLLNYRYKNPETYRANNFLSFAVFQVDGHYLENFWNMKTRTNWASPVSSMIHKRATIEFLPTQNLIEADLMLFIANILRQNDMDSIYSWYPFTLPNLERFLIGGLTLGFCEKCKSRRYFENFKPVFAVESKAELLEKWTEMAASGTYGSRVVAPAKIAAWFEKFATTA